MAVFCGPPPHPFVNHTYALVGLTPSESSLLESIFALDAKDAPGDALVPVGLGDEGRAPDLLIVNGDDLAVAQRLSAGYPRALLVLVGAPRSTQRVAWPVMPRPLDIPGIVAALSELDWPEPEPGEKPAEPPPALDSISGPPSVVSRPASTAFPSEGMSSAFAPTTASAPLSAGGAPRPSEPLSARLAWAMSEVMPADPLPRPAPRAPQPSAAVAAHQPPPVLPDVLVVHARRDGRSPSLARGLRRMGYAVVSVGSPDLALAEMERHLAPFVFFDQHSLGADFLPLARAFHALREAPTQPPHLAVLARGGSPFDRLRARMAGCAWMQIPIDRDRLANYFERRGLPRPPVRR